VRTRAGHYVQVLQLSGASFECADPTELNAWHERWNVLYRSIASPNLAIWTHLIRHGSTATRAGNLPTPSRPRSTSDTARALRASALCATTCIFRSYTGPRQAPQPGSPRDRLRLRDPKVCARRSPKLWKLARTCVRLCSPLLITTSPKSWPPRTRRGESVHQVVILQSL
jgi:hypothetical protein